MKIFYCYLTFIFFLLFGCIKFVKIENPEEKFFYLLKKNHKGKIEFINSKGDLVLENDFYYKGKFKFESDSLNTSLILYSPFGSDKIEGELKDNILLFIKIFFSPLDYISNIKLIKAFQSKKNYIFKLEGGIEIVFDENEKIKEIKLPELKIMIVWEKDLPYNIMMVTQNANINIKIDKMDIGFKNGKNSDF
ncbi:MAG: hypothetical protein ABIN23_00435 [candidate division WOR-3 bacterium]